MVQEHRGEYHSLWAAVESIAPKIGCVPQTLNEWVRKQEIDTGLRDGLTSEHFEQSYVGSRPPAAADRRIRSLRRWAESNVGSTLFANLVSDVATNCSTSNSTDAAAASEDGAGHCAHPGAGNGVPVTRRQIGATAVQTDYHDGYACK